MWARLLALCVIFIGVPLTIGAPTVGYWVQNHKYGTCLQVDGNNPANGGSLVLRPCTCIPHGSPYTGLWNLQWMTWSDQNAISYMSYDVTSAANQKQMVATVDRNGVNNGDIINQYEWVDAPNQKWKLVGAKLGEGNLFQIQSVSSGKCMTAENENRIDQWDCVGAPHQKWTVVAMKHC